MSGLHRVLQNFRMLIESITPTELLRTGARFRWSDPQRTDADVSAGTARTFCVVWRGSTAVHEVEDLTERWAIHEFAVDVSYPAEMEAEFRHMVVAQDRHDIVKTLRDPTYFVGYPGSAVPSIGLHSRELATDELTQESPQTWRYRQTWRCVICEAE